MPTLRAIVVPTVLVVLFVGFIATPSLQADWISLKHGGRFTGKIVRQNEREITIRLRDGGVTTFQMRLVEEFFRAEPRQARERRQREETQGRDAERDAPVYKRFPDDFAGPLVDRRFGAVVVAIPRNFNLKRGPGSMPGFERQLIGVYADPTSGAEVSISSGKRPLGSTDMDDLSTRLRAELEKERGASVRRLERKTIDGHDAIVGEVETRGSAVGDSTVVFSWIDVGPEQCFCIAVQVPVGRFTGVERVYRAVVTSFRHQPTREDLELPQPTADPADKAG